MKAIGLIGMAAMGACVTLHAEPIHNVGEYCSAIDRDIVNQADAASKARQALVAAGGNREKRADASVAESNAKRSLLEREEEWSRLGCAHILYQRTRAG